MQTLSSPQPCRTSTDDQDVDISGGAAVSNNAATCSGVAPGNGRQTFLGEPLSPCCLVGILESWELFSVCCVQVLAYDDDADRSWRPRFCVV